MSHAAFGPLPYPAAVSSSDLEDDGLRMHIEQAEDAALAEQLSRVTGGSMSLALATGTTLRSVSQPVLVPTGPAGPDHQLALRLHGMDLPPAGTRAVMEGKLTGRSLHVSEW
jgi:hypothetical protein